MKIILKNVVSKKPNYLYFIDRWGNLIEEQVIGGNRLTLLGKLKCIYIDFKRWFR